MKFSILAIILANALAASGTAISTTSTTSTSSHWDHTTAISTSSRTSSTSRVSTTSSTLTTKGMWDATLYPTSTSSAPASSTSDSSCTVPQWAQCGGLYYTGCTACDAPYGCQYFNDWYSQCL